MATVLFANSTDFQQKKTINELVAPFSELTKKRALRYQFPQDAYNFILGRILLKEALKKIGVPPSTIENLHYGEDGKPFLEGIKFSIAHSQHLVACAFHPSEEVGLDIEFPRNLKKTHFRHCFNDIEWASIEADVSMHTFYQYWTQKEAILKVNGAGLSRLMDIELLSTSYARFYENAEKTNYSEWNLHNFHLKGEEAYACLCTSKPFTIEMIEVLP